MDRFGGVFGQLYQIGNRVKVVIKDNEFGGRVGRITNFKHLPSGVGIDVKFPCGSVQRFDDGDLRKSF
jgi:hypothetical protein